MKAQPPAERAVASELGAAYQIWTGIIAALEGTYGPLAREWKPSKASFGQMCLLKHKKRTLLYMTPEKGSIQVAAVVGERGVALALSSNLPERIKDLLRQAMPYAEGRGIRFPVDSAADVATVTELVAIKATPK